MRKTFFKREEVPICQIYSVTKTLEKSFRKKKRLQKYSRLKKPHQSGQLKATADPNWGFFLNRGSRGLCYGLSVQFSLVAQLCLTLCNPMNCSTPGFPVHTNSQSLLQLMSIELVMPSNHFILCCPLLLLPSILPSIRVLSNESVLCIRCPNYLSFSFSISPFNEYSLLISFRIDWLDLLVVQTTLKSLLQHHSSKASIFRCSAFFMVQLS